MIDVACLTCCKDTSFPRHFFSRKGYILLCVVINVLKSVKSAGAAFVME